MNIYRPGVVAVTLLALLYLVPCVSAGTLQGVVIAVVDCETISISTGAKIPLHIQLRGISVPPNDPQAAIVAREHLSDLIMGKRVTIEAFGVGQGGNIIGVVFDGARDIGMQMIRDGAARYDGSLTGLDISAGRLYAECEAAARSEQRGIWQERATQRLAVPAAADANKAAAPLRANARPGTNATQAANQAKELSAQDKAKLLSDVAHELLQRGQAEAALPLAREAVQLLPESAVSQEVLAVALSDAGQYGAALKYAREALRIAPNMDKAHNTLGKIFFGLGRLQESVREHREAIRLNPDYAKAHYNLGVTLFAMARFGEALAAYRNAERLAPKQPVIKVNMGLTLYRLGRATEGRAKWQEALTMGDPFAAKMAQFNLSHLP